MRILIICLGLNIFTSSCENEEPINDSTQIINLDCLTGNCSELIVPGDPYQTNPNFYGYADPSIRKDLSSSTLWFAYSYPHIKVVGTDNVPSVEIHLAKSNDNGTNWQFIKKLFEPVPMDNPANPTEPGFLDHETVNLLPVNTGTESFWLAARLNYFIPSSTGFSGRPSNSFYISIIKANIPEDLTTGQIGTLGGTLTHESWSVNQTLIPPDIASDSYFWNEPALYYESSSSKLYLIMVAFVYAGNNPIISKHNTYVYSTTPSGHPNSWTWQYKGILSNESIANELGAEKLSQTDLAKSADGKLLLIASPVDWVPSENDYNNKGCKVVEIKSLEFPELERDGSGNLRVRAYITASDANNLGSGASAYDPNSITGLLFTKRVKTATQLTASINKTRIKP